MGHWPDHFSGLERTYPTAKSQIRRKDILSNKCCSSRDVQTSNILLDLKFSPDTKVILKWNRYPHAKIRTTKFLKENIGAYFHKFGLRKKFLNRIENSLITKDKHD